MTLENYKQFADLFFKHAENTEDTEWDFVQFTFNNCLSDNSPNFAEIIEELLNRVNEDIVYSYLINLHNGTSESGLAYIISKIPAVFSQEIIMAATEKANSDDCGNALNLNALLLNFINNYPRETVDEYETKVKSIIKCMNEATKLQTAELKRKDEEIQALQMRLNEQVSDEKVLAELRQPVSDFEKYIISSLQEQNPSSKQIRQAQRLIEIVSELRQKLEELYGIYPLESYDNWVMQSLVEYNPERHQLIDKPQNMNKELMVRIVTRGFVIPTENGVPCIIRAEVKHVKATSPNTRDTAKPKAKSH